MGTYKLYHIPLTADAASLADHVLLDAAEGTVLDDLAATLT